MERIKVGVIGTGHMGCNHVRNYMEEKGYFDLVGIYDIDSIQAEKVASQFKTKAYKNLDELLEQVEAVTVAVPSSLHKQIGYKVAEHGVNALIEKPLALNSADALALTEEFRKRNLILQVGHIERFNPVIVELNKILEKRQIFFVEAHRYGPFSGSGRITDTSVVEDLMIHDIDLVCNMLAPHTVTSIKSNGEKIRSNTIDFATAMIDFEGVAHAVISASRVSQGKERKIEVHCENSLIEADLLAKTLTITKNTDLYVDGYDNSKVKQDAIVQKIFVPMKEPLKQELLAFYDTIKNGIEVSVTGEMGTENVRLCEAVVKNIALENGEEK